MSLAHSEGRCGNFGCETCLRKERVAGGKRQTRKALPLARGKCDPMFLPALQLEESDRARPLLFKDSTKRIYLHATSDREDVLICFSVRAFHKAPSFYPTPRLVFGFEQQLHRGLKT